MHELALRVRNTDTILDTLWSVGCAWPHCGALMDVRGHANPYITRACTGGSGECLGLQHRLRLQPRADELPGGERRGPERRRCRPTGLGGRKPETPVSLVLGVCRRELRNVKKPHLLAKH